MNVLITNPRDMPGFVKELQQVPTLHLVHRRQHAVQRPAEQCRTSPSSTSPRCMLTLGGGMAVQRPVAERWQKVTGVRGRRRLRPHRDLAGRDCQPARHARLHRHDRPADPSTGTRYPRRRRQRAAARRGRRDLHARPAGHGRLLATARGDRQGDDAGRLASAPATSASWTSAATSTSSTARRT